jgi:hypothetical protein
MRPRRLHPARPALTALALTAALALTGCGAKIVREESLARSSSPAPRPAALSAAAPTTALPARLEGRYIATAHALEAGSLSGLLLAQARPARSGDARQGFIANTRPGGATDVIRTTEGLFRRLLAGIAFPGGAIARWESDLPALNADGTPAPGEGRVFIGPFEAARTRMTSPDAPIAVLSRSSERTLGYLTLRPAPEGAVARAGEYQRVAAAVEPALRAHLYDPALVDTPRVRAYLRSLQNAAGVAQDDVEFAFGAAAAAASNLPFSQTILARPLEPGMQERLASERRRWDEARAARAKAARDAARDPSAAAPSESSGASASDAPALDEGVALVRLVTGDSPDEVDRQLRQALASAPRALIVDVRDIFLSGPSAARLASWLHAEPLELALVTRGGTRQAAVAAKGAGLPRVSWHQVTDAAALDARATQDGALVLTSDPRALPAGATPFAGPVAVLVSRRSQSGLEPALAALRPLASVTLVGEKTPGRALVTRPVDVGDGWTLRVPVYEVLTPTGGAIDRVGVEPEVRASSDDALTAASAALRRALTATN